MTEKRFDFVVFGATGFTGAFVVEQLAKVCKNYKWAVAGRSESKLKKTLQEISSRLSFSIADVPTIVSDVANAESLVKMAKQAKVVLNCVGPYRFFMASPWSKHASKTEPVTWTLAENHSFWKI